MGENLLPCNSESQCPYQRLLVLTQTPDSDHQPLAAADFNAQMHIQLNTACHQVCLISDMGRSGTSTRLYVKCMNY